MQYIQIRVNILFLFKQNGKSQAHHQWLQAIAENVKRKTSFKGQITF